MYLSTWPRKNRLRLVPFSRMISALHQFRIVDQKRPAFSADDVLGFVEALGRQAAERAGSLPLYWANRPCALSSTTRTPWAARSRRSHPFRSPRRRNAPGRWPGSRRDQGFQLRLVEVQCVGADVGEDIRAPRRTKALTVETKVKEGTITSSPLRQSRSSAAISRAWVQEVVSSTWRAKLPLQDLVASRVNGPSPDAWPLAIASAIYRYSLPARQGRLKGSGSHSWMTEVLRFTPAAPLTRPTAGSHFACSRPNHVRRFLHARKCMRARYSPMIPRANNCAPENSAMIEARNGKPGTGCPCRKYRPRT